MRIAHVVNHLKFMTNNVAQFVIFIIYQNLKNLRPIEGVVGVKFEEVGFSAGCVNGFCIFNVQL